MILLFIKKSKMAIEKIISPPDKVGTGFLKVNQLIDETFTGGTYNNGTGILTLVKFGGGTSQITGFPTGGGTTVTGGTYTKSTGTLVLTNSTGGTFTVTGFTYVDNNSLAQSGSTIIFIKDSGVTTNKIMTNNVTLSKLQQIPNDTFLGRDNGGVTGSTTGNTQILSIVQEFLTSVPDDEFDTGIRGQKVMMDTQMATCYLPSQWAWIPRPVVKDINLKVSGSTELVSNYTGKTFIPTQNPIVEIKSDFSSTSGSTTATITIGNNAPNYDNFVTGYTINSPSANAIYTLPYSATSLSVSTTANTINCRVSGNSDYTTMNARVILFGLTI